MKFPRIDTGLETPVFLLMLVLVLGDRRPASRQQRYAALACARVTQCIKHLAMDRG